MTTTILTGGQLLRAEVAGSPVDDRIREGILVPWNEDGRTNLGRGYPIRPSFGQALAADAKVVGIYGHNREASVSRLIAHEVRPEGLWGRIFINRTELGNQLLAEIDGGARDALSIEASDLELDAAGGVVAGRLDFVAHVPVGAYDSARFHLAATVTTPNGDSVTQPAPAAPAPAAHPAPVLQANLTQGLPAPVPAAQPAPAPAAQSVPAAAPAGQDLATLLASMVAAQQAPAPVPAAAPVSQDMATLLAALSQLQAGAYAAPAASAPSAAALLGTPGVPATPGANGRPAGDPIREAATLQAGVVSTRDRTLLAALEDVTYAGLPLFQQPSGNLGEKLWEGGGYTRRWTSLMRGKDLTSMKGSSWQWTRGPEVAAWAGNKAAVPSNPVTAEEVPWTARRCAGAWDIGRELRDFGTPEFWTEFYAEQVESYLELSDTWAAEFLIAQALSIAVDGNVPASYVPLDRTIDAGPTQILKAAALGTAIMEDTPRVKTGPDWIAMNTLDWLTLADLTALDLPAFLALLKVDPSRFMRSSLVPRGQVVMGAKQATTFRELGNGAPIRVEALDVARGGIDSAVYGYVAYSHDRPGGVISVPLAAAVEAG